MGTSDQIMVPARHEVRTYRATIEPVVARGLGGALIASTGYGGDDQLREIDALVTSVEQQVAPHRVNVIARVTQLSDLFAPSEPTFDTVESAALVYFQTGSLAGIDTADRDRIITRLRAIASRTTLFVVVQPGDDLLDLTRRLRAAKLSAYAPAGDSTAYVEVRRPDGSVVGGLVGAALGDMAPAFTSGATTARVPIRSPRLDALLLAIVREDNPAHMVALEKYLRARTDAFALFATRQANGQFGVGARNFGGQAFFVAYGDERSMHRAASELGFAAGTYASAAMSREKLVPWAISAKTGVALCVFDWSGKGVWHVPLPMEMMKRLAK